MIVKTLLVAAAAIGLTGCKPEDIFASDFIKFSKCVDAATKDGHVTAWVAKNACSTKYSTVKTITVNGTGGFAYCLQEMCDSFSMDGRNSTTKTIITEVTIAVNANGRAVTGKLEKLWSEPGSAVSGVVTLSEKVNKNDREKMSWFVREVRGIDIDA
jgi:uncharacterized alpha/beta hydrolase family protein